MRRGERMKPMWGRQRVVTLADIVKGCTLCGLAGPNSVRTTVVDASWRAGDAAKQVVYRLPDGTLGQRVVFAAEAADLSLVDEPRWSFEADPRDFKLAAEARRMQLAHLYDPFLAVHASAVEPLPHQISAVYEEMLPRIPLRFVLADDPGAGKTIMTGLLVKEMLARGDLKRCLVVCPGNLVEQWQDELNEKFGLRFAIMTNDALEASVSRNAFAETDLAIARLDKLARSDEVQTLLRQTRWDLIVCDEAHKMSATMGADGPKTTKRFRLGRLLGTLTPNLLLLTATPHNGKPQDFQLFMSLVDQDQFEGAVRNEGQSIDAQSSMRRLVKEDLLKFDGTPLFPERRAYAVRYTLSPDEQGLYDAVTDYVKHEFNRADNLDGKRRTSVGFALTSLQRRLASSPEAIWRSLQRRHERLQKRLAQCRTEMAEAARRGAADPYATGGLAAASSLLAEDFDEDDWTPEEAETAEENVMDAATTAETIAELENEIATLALLERRAARVRASGNDRKWDELSRILQDDPLLRDAAGNRLKLIIFTEYRDTLDYLVGKIRSLLGSPSAVVSIYGGMGRDARKAAQDRFRQDAEACVLVATDAAGEGVNLQRAHLMVNYDLPWNPNRLEQRFGRIHRIGQTEVCHLWNLVAADTREGDVYNRLLLKLGEERGALGGKVFDVLGSVTFENRPLRDLLIEAVRYGDQPDVRARLHQVVDRAFDPTALQDLVDRYALTDDRLDAGKVAEIRAEMDRLATRRLQPHFVSAFLQEALERFGGRIVMREPGRYQVRRVPGVFRSTPAGRGRVLEAYERVCFDRTLAQMEGAPPADVVCPGHPLFDAAVELISDRLDATLEQGTVLVDETDEGCEARLAVSILDEIVDGLGRTVYKGVQAVEFGRDGEAHDGGPAPYLDYRVPTPDEQSVIEAYLQNETWLGCVEAEQIAGDYALGTLVPQHLAFQRARRTQRLDKIERNVRERLDAEINYYDSQHWRFSEQAKAGKPNAEVNAANAKRRADELAERKRQRLADIAAERSLSANVPEVTTVAVVVPMGLVRWLMGGAPQTLAGIAVAEQEAADRRAVELAAMETVMAIERELGNEPVDVSAQKVGYDIESRVPPAPDGSLRPARFIEVKGRAMGAGTVTVSRNEILCALNAAEQFVLAVVEVGPAQTHTTYLRAPCFGEPSTATVTSSYSIQRLKALSHVELEQERTR